MTSKLRILGLPLLLLMMMPALASAQTREELELTYELTVDIDGDPGDGVAGGEIKIGPTRNVQVIVHDGKVNGATDGEVDTIRIYEPGIEVTDHYFEFSTRWTDAPLGVGSYKEAQWVPGKVAGNYLFIQTPVTDVRGVCYSGVGEFTVAAADFQKVTTASGSEILVAKSFQVAWDLKCELVAEARNRGTLSLTLVDEVGGGTDPQPQPPVNYVSIIAPPAGISLGTANSGTVAISTTTQQGYQGAVHLEAYGPPGIEVTFDPQVIPAPGNGSSVVHVEVDEWVLPMRHLIEIRAVGPPRPSSIVLPVELSCEPPFVSAREFPTSVIVLEGASTTLRVPAVGSPTLHYQWYEGPRGSRWNPVEGGTGAELSVGPVNGTRYFWVRVTNGCGSWDSPTVRVGNAPPRRRPIGN